MDDPLLVGVLQRLADRHEQLQPLAGRKLLFIAKLRNRHALDQLHHEVGPARIGGAGVEHLGDIRMVHHRQGLPLGLEPGDHLPGIHAGLDDFQGHPPLDRLGLIGHVDDAKTPLADLLEEFIGADDRAGFLGDGLVDGGYVDSTVVLKKLPELGLGMEKKFNAAMQSWVVSTCPIEIGRTLGGRFPVHRCIEDGFDFGFFVTHTGLL